MIEHYRRNERYLAYLTSPEWKAKRQAVKERCKGICERCRKYLLDEVHHLTYARVFNELLEDLQGLCAPCHRFLHGKTGIDPTVASLHLKVTAARIEFWDRSANKVRRIRRSDVGHEGKYLVPIDVLLDGSGNPVFEPSRWSRFSTASRSEGRTIPPNPEIVRTEVFGREDRKTVERQRMKECPEQYTNFAGAAPESAKATIALVKQFARFFDRGFEWQISNVRSTKTRGVVLDLRMAHGNGLRMMKHYDFERCLTDGTVLLDRGRAMWVSVDQEPLPALVLERFA